MPGVEFGSGWSDLVTWAKFLIEPVPVTFALNVNTTEASFSILATVPVKTPAAKEVFAEPDTYSNPAGSTSLISTLVAADVPALVTLIV